jgi:reverse transcriptase-like protein
MLQISPATLDWAIKHTTVFGDTDIFPVPFEYKAIQHDWVTIRDYLSGIDVLNWTTRPHRTLLSPKARYGFRPATQLDPLDFLIYASLVYEIGSDLEAKRIPVSDQTVFSYRFAPDGNGRIFDAAIGYGQFQSHSESLSSGNGFSHVVVADIADFYPRIYVHRLENALNNATRKGNHVKALRNLLSGWNGTESYGIPVGSAPSRLLSEITISDVDDLLKAYGVTFTRFNDDYRLFAKSKNEAYRTLTILADYLYTNHGLSLQPQKTKIVKIENFRQTYLPSPEDRELDSFRSRFHDLVSELGLENNYEEIDPDDLSDEQQAEIDRMNIGELFRAEIARGEEADLGAMRFLIRRLTQLGNDEVLEDIFQNMEVLHALFPDVIRYLQSLRNVSPENRRNIASRILELLQNSIVAEMHYHRMWALTLFTETEEWDNEDKFLNLLGILSDQFSRRKLILSLGCSGQTGWFQSRWRTLFDEPHWSRRALIFGASCMPSDARRHWYDSIEPRLDVLEKTVVKWARHKPFADS